MYGGFALLPHSLLTIRHFVQTVIESRMPFNSQRTIKYLLEHDMIESYCAQSRDPCENLEKDTKVLIGNVNP